MPSLSKPSARAPSQANEMDAFDRRTPPPAKKRKVLVRDGGQRFKQEDVVDYGLGVLKVSVNHFGGPTTFTVHEKLLMKIPYFELTMYDKVPLANGSIDISLDDPALFAIFVQWLYTDRLHTKLTNNAPEIGDKAHQQEWVKLVDLYLLGVQLDSVVFCDTVMDALLQWCQEALQMDRKIILHVVDKVYQNLPSGNSLCRLVSDIVVWHFKGEIIHDLQTFPAHDQLPTAFLLEVIRKVAKHEEKKKGFISPVTRGVGTCMYHFHSGGECYRYKWETEPGIGG